MPSVAVLLLENMAHEGIAVRAAPRFFEGHNSIAGAYDNPGEQTAAFGKPDYAGVPGAIEVTIAVDPTAAFGEFAIQDGNTRGGGSSGIASGELGDDVEMGRCVRAQSTHIQNRADYFFL